MTERCKECELLMPPPDSGVCQDNANIAIVAYIISGYDTPRHPMLARLLDIAQAQ